MIIIHVMTADILLVNGIVICCDMRSYGDILVLWRRVLYLIYNTVVFGCIGGCLISTPWASRIVVVHVRCAHGWGLADFMNRRHGPPWSLWFSCGAHVAEDQRISCIDAVGLHDRCGSRAMRTWLRIGGSHVSTPWASMIIVVHMRWAHGWGFSDVRNLRVMTVLFPPLVLAWSFYCLLSFCYLKRGTLSAISRSGSSFFSTYLGKFVLLGASRFSYRLVCLLWDKGLGEACGMLVFVWKGLRKRVSGRGVRDFVTNLLDGSGWSPRVISFSTCSSPPFKQKRASVVRKQSSLESLPLFPGGIILTSPLFQ